MMHQKNDLYGLDPKMILFAGEGDFQKFFCIIAEFSELGKSLSRTNVLFEGPPQMNHMMHRGVTYENVDIFFQGR